MPAPGKDRRTDLIAREAARLIQTGRAEHIGAAILAAASGMGFGDAPLPSRERVRKHAQAMSMQAMGSGAYEASRTGMLRIAEEIMTVLEEAVPDAETLLVGRAAQGHLDAGVVIHIRIYCRTAIGEIAAALVEYGYEEPQFATADTRHGRLSQSHFAEDGHEITITRCLPDMRAAAEFDLFTGRRIHHLTLAQLRRFIEEAAA